MRLQGSGSRRGRNSGFTLVELMVVVSIMAILVTVTVVSVNFDYSRDRVRAAGRQIQSFLAGARDRAIYSKEIRGVRFILAPTSGPPVAGIPNPAHMAVAMQYIGAGDRLSQGTVLFPSTTLFPNGTGDIIQIPNAVALQTAGMLGIGSLIEIPKASGSYFAVSSKVTAAANGIDGTVLLNRTCSSYSGINSTATYAILLQPTTLMGSEPVQLPAGVAIDLDGSQVPSSWRPASTNSLQNYSTTLDILFNPRGNVIGDAAVTGIVHLLLADTGDISKWSAIQGRIQKVSPTTAQWSPPAVPVNQPNMPPVVTRDQIVVSLNGRTGNSSVHRANPTPSSTNTAIAADPYSYAETGQVTNQ